LPSTPGLICSVLIVLVWLIALAIFLVRKLVELLGKENAKVFS